MKNRNYRTTSADMTLIRYCFGTGAIMSKKTRESLGIEGKIIMAAADLVLARRLKKLGVLERKIRTVSCTERDEPIRGNPCFRQSVGPEGDGLPESKFCDECKEGRRAYRNALAAGRRAAIAIRTLDGLVAKITKGLPTVPKRADQKKAIKDAAGVDDGPRDEDREPIASYGPGVILGGERMGGL